MYRRSRKGLRVLKCDMSDEESFKVAFSWIGWVALMFWLITRAYLGERRFVQQVTINLIRSFSFAAARHERKKIYDDFER